LIDDNEMRVSIRRYLLNNKGYLVFSATDAIEAQARIGACDLVVASWPHVRDVAKLAHQHYAVPFVVLTETHDTVDSFIEADLVITPSAPWEIVDIVHTFSQRKRGPKPSTFRATIERKQA
jgi:DNA-binding response OmpR family regulator